MQDAVHEDVRKEVMASVKLELEGAFTAVLNSYDDGTHKDHQDFAREVEASLKKWVESAEQNKLNA